MKTVLSIAGSDCSGGAGIQADLKTFSAHKVYGMAVISSVTAQNTLGVSDVFNLPALIVEEQLESVFSDIFPDAVKIGMLGNTEIVKAVARMLKKYQPSNIVAASAFSRSAAACFLRSSSSRAFFSLSASASALCSKSVVASENCEQSKTE